MRRLLFLTASLLVGMSTVGVGLQVVTDCPPGLGPALTGWAVNFVLAMLLSAPWFRLPRSARIGGGWANRSPRLVGFRVMAWLGRMILTGAWGIVSLAPRVRTLRATSRFRLRPGAWPKPGVAAHQTPDVGRRYRRQRPL